MRVWYNGRTSAFQAEDVGSTPISRSNKRSLCHIQTQGFFYCRTQPGRTAFARWAGFRLQLHQFRLQVLQFLIQAVLVLVVVLVGLQTGFDVGVLGGEIATVHRGCVAELLQRAVEVDDHELTLGGPDRACAEHFMVDFTAGQVGQRSRVRQQLLQLLLTLADTDAELGAVRLLLHSLCALPARRAAGVALRVELLGVGRVQDVVHKQVQRVVDAAQLLLRVGLVQGDDLRVVLQRVQQVVAHRVVARQVQRRAAAKVCLIPKVICPRLRLAGLIEVVRVRLPQVQEEHRVGRVHRILAHAREHAAEPPVDLVSEQLGAAPALGNITAVLIVQPAEALADEFDLAVAQHQVLQAADGLQGRVVQRRLGLLHGIGKHGRKVAVLDVPVHAKAVHRAPDRSLIGCRAGFAVLNVLCKDPIQILSIQTNSS